MYLKVLLPMLRLGFGGCRSLLLLLAWSCKSTFLVKYCVTYLGTRLFKHLKLRIHFCIVLLGVRLNQLSTREVSSEAYSPRNDPQINPENKDTDPEMIPIFFASTLKCSSVLIKIFGVEWYSSTELLQCHDPCGFRLSFFLLLSILDKVSSINQG